ncbi:HNH endonuclease [Aliamphritea hakodatensis]|uniref:HNH endonuclease n=1 Tax=Aliamphritea hakodatensis TaxID=2895352 RepID=UPI0035E40A6C
MPARVPKACRQAGCPNTTIERHGYCPAHADKATSWKSGRAGRGRGGRPWRRKRETVKERAKGLCRLCEQSGRLMPGSICDHIVPEAEGGTDSLNNLQWLCSTCSDEKTRQEAHRGRLRSAGKG